jgi:hypothetical protein
MEMVFMSRSALTAALAGVAASALLISPAAAAGPDAGLYGAGDPTYDGVFRQSLALTALNGAGAKIPASAIDWLASQQCLDGAFVSYRPSIRTACPVPDPENFTGPDSNSTAMAAMALAAVGRMGAADKASKILVSWQNADGGWSYIPGGASDVNSTALALQALDRSTNDEVRAETRGRTYLVRQLGACNKGSAGLPFQGGGAINDFASAQALAGLGTALPVQEQPDQYTPSQKCTVKTATKLSNFLVDRLKQSAGVLPNSMDPAKPDYSATIWAVIGLEGAGRPAKQFASSISALKRNGKAWVTGNGAVDAGRAAAMALVAETTGANAKSFGGTNYVSLIAQSLRK